MDNLNWKKVEKVLEDYYICNVTKNDLFHLSDTGDYGFYLMDSFINFFDYREVDFYSGNLTEALNKNSKDYIHYDVNSFSILIDYLFEYKLLNLYEHDSINEAKEYLLKKYNDG